MKMLTKVGIGALAAIVGSLAMAAPASAHERMDRYARYEQRDRELRGERERRSDGFERERRDRDNRLERERRDRNYRLDRERQAHEHAGRLHDFSRRDRDWR
jgi:hypothetical protein